VRIALVKVSPQPDVPVGQCENRFCLPHGGQIEAVLPNSPWFDGELVLLDHSLLANLSRWSTTTPQSGTSSAPRMRSPPSVGQ
jgi:hypothetical protein